MKRWIPLYVIGGLAGASGINGVIALWMPVENTDDSLLGNFRFFLIMTMILNIFVSLEIVSRGSRDYSLQHDRLISHVTNDPLMSHDRILRA